jgi:hypothetical protein
MYSNPGQRQTTSGTPPLHALSWMSVRIRDCTLQKLIRHVEAEINRAS